MKHTTRLTILGILAAICLIGEIVLMALGRFSEVESGVLGGMLGLLIPVLIDAAVVEKRRKDPLIPAIPDDVYKPMPIPEPRKEYSPIE
jgi:hypothetical protein